MVKIGDGQTAGSSVRSPSTPTITASASPYAELYLRDKQPRMIAEMRKSFDYVLANPRDNNFEFDKEKNPHAPRALVVVRRALHVAAGVAPADRRDRRHALPRIRRREMVGHFGFSL